MVEADGTAVSWSYDAAYRLTGETLTNPAGVTTAAASYAYDAAGNRTSLTTGGATTTYAYNPLDQLTSAATGNQMTTYTYDGRGNLTGTSSGNGAKATTASYSYDAADRLSGATLSSGFSATYGYDADGRRVKQTVGTAVTNYLWDEQSPYGDVVMESDGSGAIQASYVLGGGALLAQVRSGTASYVLPDGQGSVRALANSAGAITDTYRYDAYGNLTASSGTTPNPYRYDGQRLDDGTGLYQLRARSYDPGTGRFLSRDTAGVDVSDPAQLNRYGYAGDNPINFRDPSGHDFAQYLISIGVRVPVGVPPVVTVGVAVGAILILLGLLRFAVALPRAVPVAVNTPAPKQPEPDWVVRAGVAAPDSLQKGYSLHLGVPGLYGFSVQYQPGLTREQLAIAGRFLNKRVSYATSEELFTALAAAGYTGKLTKSPGPGLHYTFSVLRNGVMLQKLPLDAAVVLSATFRQMPNPLAP